MQKLQNCKSSPAMRTFQPAADLVPSPSPRAKSRSVVQTPCCRVVTVLSLILRILGVMLLKVVLILQHVHPPATTVVQTRSRRSPGCQPPSPRASPLKQQDCDLYNKSS